MSGDPSRRRAFVIKAQQRNKFIEKKPMNITMDNTVLKVAREIFDLLPMRSMEKHYHNAFKIGLSHYNIKFESERYVPVFYKDKLVTDLRMDLVVDDSLIVELKSVTELTDEHKNQLQRYMRLTGIENGLLINFGGLDLQILKARGIPVEWS
jgi:GxxExxY protein